MSASLLLVEEKFITDCWLGEKYPNNGIMGVPITFFDKHNPNQFEIIDCKEPAIDIETLKKMPKFKEYKSRQILVNDKVCQKTYHRLFIRRKGR